MGKKQLHFYGGEWVSFMPFAIFLLLIIQTTFIWGSISNGALWIPAFVAIAVTFFFAKEKDHYSAAIIDGMANTEAILPIVCWIFAGVFSHILRESGLATALAGIAVDMGVGPTLFLVITLFASGLFASASGTGFGTIAAGMGILYPAGLLLGCHPPLLAGVIISGAAFGDNLAPVSDTTICSATSQDTDIPGVVRSRIKYAIPAITITLIAIFILSAMLTSEGQDLTTHVDYNPYALFMLVCVTITIYAAVKTGDIIVATLIGSVTGIIIGVTFGLFDLIQVDPVNTTTNAVIRVSGEGLDRTVNGILFSGISSMLQVCILALLLFGSISVMRLGRGDLRLLKALDKVAKTPVGAEFVISFMVILLSSIMGLNAPAILAVGASFAKPLGKKFGLGVYRVANLLSAQATTLVYALPWTPSVIFTIGFAATTEAPLRAIDVTHFAIYPYALLVVMILSIFTGTGRKDAPKDA